MPMQFRDRTFTAVDQGIEACSQRIKFPRASSNAQFAPADCSIECPRRTLTQIQLIQQKINDSLRQNAVAWAQKLPSDIRH